MDPPKVALPLGGVIVDIGDSGRIELDACDPNVVVCIVKGVLDHIPVRVSVGLQAARADFQPIRNVPWNVCHRVDRLLNDAAIPADIFGRLSGTFQECQRDPRLPWRR